ncbi:hypothetical protein ACFLU8_04775 [Chloroflexota bacterium]
MRRLVPIEQLIDDAEQEGINPSHMLVDPEDVCSVDPDDLELDEDEGEE